MGLLYDDLIGISVFYDLIYELVGLHISGNSSFSGDLYETSCFTASFSSGRSHNTSRSTKRMKTNKYNPIHFHEGKFSSDFHKYSIVSIRLKRLIL